MTDSNYYRARIQNALEFIEAHLGNKFSVADVAQAAHFSEYHFHRLFPAFTGEPIHQYVRSRRLERAATLLKENPQIRLLDLALEVGFETHSAFSRAFRQHFGVSPSQFKDGQAWSNTFDPARPFLKTIAAHQITLEFSIKHLPQLFLVYKVAHGTLSGQFFVGQRLDQEFADLIQQSTSGLYGVASAFPTGPQSLNDPTVEAWYGGLFPDPELCSWSKQNLPIEAGKWAVFDYRGAHEYLHQAWNQIYRAWLPEANYILRDTLPFEMYINNPHDVAPEEVLTQIWLPIE